MITRKTLLVFFALFAAGVIAILSGRMLGTGADAEEEARAGHQIGGIGGALDQAIGLTPGKVPMRRD